MGLFLPRGFQKPSAGSTRVNWKHPLADGLLACYPINEGAGSVFYDATGRYSASSVGSVSDWVWASDLVGITHGNVSDVTDDRPFASTRELVPPATITLAVLSQSAPVGGIWPEGSGGQIWRHELGGLSAYNANSHDGMSGIGNATVMSFGGYGWFGNVECRTRWIWNDASASNLAATVPGLSESAAPEPVWCISTYDGSTASIYVMAPRVGRWATATSAYSKTLNSVSQQITPWSHRPYAGSLNYSGVSACKKSYWAMWSRALSATDAQALVAEPYAFLTR